MEGICALDHFVLMNCIFFMENFSYKEYLTCILDKQEILLSYIKGLTLTSTFDNA